MKMRETEGKVVVTLTDEQYRGLLDYVKATVADLTFIRDGENGAEDGITPFIEDGVALIQSVEPEYDYERDLYPDLDDEGEE